MVQQLNIERIKKYIQQKRRKILGISAVAVGVLLIVQLALPSSFIVPRTYLGTWDVGLESHDEVKKQLAEKTGTISLRFGARTEQVSSDKVGLKTNVADTVKQLPSLTLKDKLIPFMPVYKAIKKDTLLPVVIQDQKAIRAFAEETSKRLHKDPVNAVAEIKDGQLAITKDIDGETYTPAAIETALRGHDLLAEQHIDVIPTRIPAQVQEKHLLHLKDEYAKKTAQPLTVQYGNTKKVIEPEALKKWLTVTHIAETNTWTLTFKSEAIDPSLQAWTNEYTVAPGITQLSLHDDVEVSRRVGAAGRTLNGAAVKDQLQTWIKNPASEPVALATQVLAPRLVVSRTYSRSSAQLQAQIDRWIASHSGKYQVAIRELGGRGREASHNVAQQTVMASTYKTFLAFVAYRQAETGALDLSVSLTDGKNIEQCIEVMIVSSDNNCAIQLGRHIGWAKVDEVIASAGFQGIVLNNYDERGALRGDKLVNAREQAKFLAQLSAGSLNNQANTDRLLSYMKRQTYRAGIPAGSRGAPVADKVGFLGAYIHDVGIVYGSKSTYALVIMSQGSSWGNIKDLAQAVYDFMNE